MALVLRSGAEQVRSARARYKRWRTVWRWEHEEMEERVRLHPEKLNVNRSIVEKPFGTMKRAFNQDCLFLRGLRKVRRRGWIYDAGVQHVEDH